MVERIDLRTRFSKTFEAIDGSSGYAQTYMHAIHFWAEDQWKDISNTFVLDPNQSDVYRNEANEFTINVPTSAQAAESLGTLDTILKLTDGSAITTISADHIDLGQGAEVADNIATFVTQNGESFHIYADHEGANLYQTIQYDELADIAFTIRTESPLEVMDDGSLLIKDGEKEWLFGTVLELLALDNRSATTPNTVLTWHVEQESASTYRLSIQTDRSIQQAFDQEGTIVLNTILQHRESTSNRANQSTIEDAYIQQGYPTIATWNQFNMYVGKDNWYGKAVTRIYIKFDMPSLPEGTTITAAQARMYQYTTEGSSNYRLYHCRVTQDWYNSTSRNYLTWNNPASHSQSTCVQTPYTSRSTGWKYFDILTPVNAWYNGTSNHGLRFSMDGESNPATLFHAKNCSTQCGNGTTRPYMYITYSYGPSMYVNGGINISPSNTVASGTSVIASFQAKNNGGATYSGQVSVSNSSSPAFTPMSVSIGAGSTYNYVNSKTFTTNGSYTLCAQYLNNSSWTTLPTTGGGQNCQTVNVVDPADVQLSTGLVVSPNEVPHTGGLINATFTVQNLGQATASEKFRARVVGGTATFNESSTQSIPQNGTYTYSANATFDTTGTYEVIAEHYVDGAWTAIIGDSNDYIRVLAEPPPQEEEALGAPPHTGNAGEPVNTATGNYYYNIQDMADPSAGLPLFVSRWYNAITADTAVGPFGCGSSWMYSTSIEWRSDKSAVVRMGDGHAIYFLGSIDPNNPTDMSGMYANQDANDIADLERFGNGTANLTLADGTLYTFDVNGRISLITTPYPASLTFDYTNNLLTKITHSNGRIYDITYTSSGGHDVISMISSSGGRSVSYQYDTDCNLIQVTRPDASTLTYVYDSNHRMTEGYDARGKPVR